MIEHWPGKTIMIHISSCSHQSDDVDPNTRYIIIARIMITRASLFLGVIHLHPIQQVIWYGKEPVISATDSCLPLKTFTIIKVPCNLQSKVNMAFYINFTPAFSSLTSSRYMHEILKCRKPSISRQLNYHVFINKKSVRPSDYAD